MAADPTPWNGVGVVVQIRMRELVLHIGSVGDSRNYQMRLPRQLPHSGSSMIAGFRVRLGWTESR
jgi:hypothetical protein